MSQLQQFSFGHDGLMSQVRVQIDEQGRALFVGNDVAELLGYVKPRNAIAAHCKGALIQGVPTAGGMQQMTMITEPDVYRLIFRSQLPAAEKFERWVVEEVLPAIRQQGFYQMQASVKAAAPIINLQKQALTLLNKLQKEQDPALRNFLHGMLSNVSTLLGQAAPPLLAIGKAVDPNAEPELATQFFSHLEKLTKLGEQLNHSADPTLLAINLNEYTSACQRHGLPEQHKATLLKDLKASKRLRDASLAVRSVITHKPVKCWVFAGAAA